MQISSKQNVIINDTPVLKPAVVSTLYPEDFMYYKDLTIDQSKVVGGTHNNFPMLLKLYDPDLDELAQPDGFDIVFFSTTHDRWLEHEIEKYTQHYNSTHAELIAWIQIPTLSNSGPVEIKMYFGGKTIFNSEEDAYTLWSNYRGVWHLSESPTGTILDSTLYTNHGSSQGTMAASALVDGQINKAIHFDGSNDYLDFGDITFGANAITVSFWMKADQRSTMSCIDKFVYDAGLFEPAGWSIRLQSDGDLEFIVGNEGWIGGSGSITASGVYSGQTWVYVTCTYNGGTARIFINGAQERSGTFYGLGHIDDNNVRLRFGAPYSVPYGNRFDGVLDDVHISNFAHPADWIATEYSNQNDPENFYSIGDLCAFDLAPKVQIISPIDLSTYNPPSLTITATITDVETQVVDDVKATIDGGFPFDIQMSLVNTDTWECNWDFSDSMYPAGDYDITIVAYDDNGNINNTESVTVTIEKDLTGPIITFVNPSYDGENAGDSFDITATITDPGGNYPDAGDVIATIKYGSITQFNLKMNRIGLTNDWTVGWSNVSSSYYPLGNYNIDITATDTSYYRNVGNVASRMVTLIDIHAPTVIFDSSMQTGPYGQYQINEVIEIKATITDSKSTVTKAIAMISCTESFNITMSLNAGVWICTWDNLTEYSNGDYTITIWAIDDAGNINDKESIVMNINHLKSPVSGDDGSLIIIIAIVAVIGSVGAVGTYGIIKMKNKNKIGSKLDDKLVKLQSGIKQTKTSLKEAKSSLKASIPPPKDKKLDKKAKEILDKKRHNLTPLPKQNDSRKLSKIQAQDVYMKKELKKKSTDEKLDLLKRHL
ncbi:MAG: LamG-like jellyroll fold domain-containing protein [Promethearchaeota archaeon]